MHLKCAHREGGNHGVECPPHHWSRPENTTVNHLLTGRERHTQGGGGGRQRLLLCAGHLRYETEDFDAPVWV